MRGTESRGGEWGSGGFWSGTVLPTAQMIASPNHRPKSVFLEIHSEGVSKQDGKICQ